MQFIFEQQVVARYCRFSGQVSSRISKKETLERAREIYYPFKSPMFAIERMSLYCVLVPLKKICLLYHYFAIYNTAGYSSCSSVG